MPLLLVLGVLFALLSSLGGFLLLSYLFLTQRGAPRLTPINKTRDELPLVSLIVTAKNEGKTIERCLRSILSQTYPNLEILVVDDSSTDNTIDVVTQVAKDYGRIRLIEAGEKPEGWIGKSWPCWRGYESSKGGLLLFFDADSFFEKIECVQESVEYVLDEGIDIFSLTPRVITKGIWSNSTIPIFSAAIDILYPMEHVNDPKSSRAYVYGTYVLVRREAYEKIDGHRAVRELIVEDAALARRAKASGLKLRVKQAPNYFATEWEEERKAIYSGMERVMSSSIRAYGLISILDAIFVFFVALYPLLFILFGLVLDYHLLLTNQVFQIGFIASVLNVVFMLLIVSNELKKVVGRIGLLPLLYPLGIVLFISAIVTTSIKVSRGDAAIEWKGVKYSQATSN